MADAVLGESLRQRDEDFAGGAWAGFGVGFIVVFGEPEAAELLGDSLDGGIGGEGFGVGGGAPDGELGGFGGFGEGEEGGEGVEVG